MSKVIIGIVGKHIKDDKIRTNTLIRDEIKQAVFEMVLLVLEYYLQMMKYYILLMIGKILKKK